VPAQVFWTGAEKYAVACIFAPPVTQAADPGWSENAKRSVRTCMPSRRSKTRLNSTVKYNYAWYNYLGLCTVKFTSRCCFWRIVDAVLNGCSGDGAGGESHRLLTLGSCMLIDSDIAWVDQPSGQDQVVATKLHVLHLDAIKEKLGNKWDRLSNLVHTLFEKTLRQAQGPSDQLLLVDEMSYIVTFRNLSAEEASVACVAAAKKVCQILFGAEIDNISVRGLVGPVPLDLLHKAAANSGKIADILERHGREIIVTPQSAAPSRSSEERGKSQAGRQGMDWIDNAHKCAALARTSIGFFPAWDLKKRKSASLFLSAFSSHNKSRLGVRRVFNGSSESQVVEMEVALLNAAAEYARRVYAALKVCAIGVGVSYETLSGGNSRIRYIGALKAVQTVQTCPLLLRVEQIPNGTPLGRLAEIVTMLSVPNVRVILEFESLRHLPEIDIRLGAAGLGGSLRTCDGNVAGAVGKLARRAAEQRAFAFLHDIDCNEGLDVAMLNEIRMGSGDAISSKHCYTGHEPVPNFPLHC